MMARPRGCFLTNMHTKDKNSEHNCTMWQQTDINQCGYFNLGFHPIIRELTNIRVSKSIFWATMLGYVWRQKMLPRIYVCNAIKRDRRPQQRQFFFAKAANLSLVASSNNECRISKRQMSRERTRVPMQGIVKHTVRYYLLR